MSDVAGQSTVYGAYDVPQIYLSLVMLVVKLDTKSCEALTTLRPWLAIFGYGLYATHSEANATKSTFKFTIIFEEVWRQFAAFYEIYRTQFC